MSPFEINKAHGEKMVHKRGMFTSDTVDENGEKNIKYHEYENGWLIKEYAVILLIRGDFN